MRPELFLSTKAVGASSAPGAYATTSPIYVTVRGKRAYAKEDAEYFKAWIDRTIAITDQYPGWNSAEEKQLVMKRLHDARNIYENLQ